MHCIRYYVTEIEYFECALVRYNYTVSTESKPGSENFFTRRGRILAKPVQTSPNPHEPAAFNVMGQERAAYSAFTRLFGCEVTSLAGGYVEQARSTISRITRTGFDTKHVTHMSKVI